MTIRSVRYIIVGVLYSCVSARTRGVALYADGVTCMCVLICESQGLRIYTYTVIIYKFYT